MRKQQTQSTFGERTAKNHISSIYGKTGIHQRFRVIEAYKKYRLRQGIESRD